MSIDKLAHATRLHNHLARTRSCVCVCVDFGALNVRPFGNGIQVLFSNLLSVITIKLIENSRENEEEEEDVFFYVLIVLIDTHTPLPVLTN